VVIDPVDDLPKLALIILITFLTVTWIWTVIDHRSRAAAVMRLAWSGRGRRWILIVVALAVFAVVAEDVAFQESDESVLKLDKRVHAIAKQLAPSIRKTAGVVGRLTGEGLAVAVALAILGLAARGHSYRAAVVFMGTISAWALSGILKVAFGVHRPRWNPAMLHPGDGFPSGHALVTLVACILIARALGHDRGPRVRIVFLTCAWAIALLAGGARIVAKAHWTSDVIAGFAVGAAWSTMVTMLSDSWHAARDAAVPAPPIERSSTPLAPSRATRRRVALGRGFLKDVGQGVAGWALRISRQ
jgi:membrane-associated phospholipid phosphatase